MSTGLEESLPSVDESERPSFVRRSISDLSGVIVVIIGVLAGNFSYWSGRVTANPLATVSAVARVLQWGPHRGTPTIDANVGLSSQALGHLAAESLLHGHVPWWNFYEGFGAPLVGEMQSAALFPLTPLLALSNGQLVLHVVLEIIAGLATFALIRVMGLSVIPAVAAGVAFSLNGSFAWIANAVVNPICFLPVCLLGVELARRRATRSRVGGWIILALGIALSIAAGFPEVAFFDGLLVIVWVGARSIRMNRGDAVRFLRKIGYGVLAGVALGSPILVAFFDYVRVGGLGPHGMGQFSHASLSPIARPLTLLPYVYDVPWNHASTPAVRAAVGGVGGFVGVACLFLALVAVRGTRQRVLRWALWAWIVAAIGASWGWLGLHDLFNLIPGVATMSLNRYIPASYEMALVVLAAFGLDDLVRGDRRPIRIALAGVGSGVLLLWAALAASSTRHVIGATSGLSSFDVRWSFGVLVACVAVVFILRTRVATIAVLLVVVADSLVGFVPPTTYGVHSYKVDWPAQHFLQTHLGQERFYSMYSEAPNYGSYFATPQINLYDLPVPRPFLAYVPAKLDANASGYTFFGWLRVDSKGPTALQEFARNITNFEQVGVKYLVMGTTRVPSNVFTSLGVRTVFRGKVLTISELPNVRPFFSATAGCRVSSTSFTVAAVQCAHPGTVYRLEESMPGWTATRNGQNIPVATWHVAFQQVRVPRGRSVLRFTFVPPNETPALVAFVVALFVVVCSGIFAPWWNRRSRRRDAASVDDTDELRRHTAETDETSG